MSIRPSDPLLRAAGLLAELPDDGEQTAALSIDIPLDEVLALLGRITAAVEKIDMRLHRIEQGLIADPGRVV